MWGTKNPTMSLAQMKFFILFLCGKNLSLGWYKISNKLSSSPLTCMKPNSLFFCSLWPKKKCCSCERLLSSFHLPFQKLCSVALFAVRARIKMFWEFSKQVRSIYNYISNQLSVCLIFPLNYFATRASVAKHKNIRKSHINKISCQDGGYSWTRQPARNKNGRIT